MADGVVLCLVMHGANEPKCCKGQTSQAHRQPQCAGAPLGHAQAKEPGRKGLRHASGHRTHHLHVVVHGGPAWQDRLRFRDMLRAEPGVAARYATLKQELSRGHAGDREAHT